MRWRAMPAMLGAMPRRWQARSLPNQPECARVALMAVVPAKIGIHAIAIRVELSSAPAWEGTLGIQEAVHGVTSQSWRSRRVVWHRCEVRASRIPFTSALAFRSLHAPAARGVQHVNTAAVFALVQRGDLGPGNSKRTAGKACHQRRQGESNDRR